MKTIGNGDSAKRTNTEEGNGRKNQDYTPNAPGKDETYEKSASRDDYRHDEYDDYNPW